MSVIDCLSAGFRFVRWRLELLVIPVLLDLFLWLAPPLRVTSLVVQLAEWYRSLAAVSGMPAATVELTQQMADSLEQSSDAFNLLSALTSTWLLHMPSLLAGTAQPSPSAIEVGTPAEALLFWILFTLLGLLLGVIYLSLLARSLPIGSLSGLPPRLLPARVLLHWLRILGLLLLILLLLLAIYLPLSLAIGLLTLLNPAIGSLLALASGALSLLVFFYLYFATAAVVMDTLSPVAALRRSLQVARSHFLSTLGFIALSSLIGLGIALLLVQLLNSAEWALFPALVVNAFVGSGLAMALLIFYRTHYLASDAELVR